jgi:hypothetical protein
MTSELQMKLIIDLTNNGIETRREKFGEVVRQVIDVEQSLLSAAICQKLVELGWTPPGEYKEEVLRLMLICQAAHDRLLRGDDDTELLAILAEAWDKPVCEN